MTGGRVTVIRSTATPFVTGLTTCMAVVGIALLASCAKPQTAAPAEAPGPAAASSPTTQTQVNRTMAYEHTVSVELDKSALSGRVREVQSACEQRTELGCTLLDITLDEHSSVSSAHITMRLAPGQVEPMIQIAARGARILARRTHAEDLAQPIADTEQRMSLLSMHRDRLSEFLKHPDLKIDDVLALSKEISSTQAEIEGLTASRSNMQRRIDTESLTLDLYPPEGSYSAAETPVRNALRSFGDDFAQTLAMLIHVFAFLLPVGLTVGLVGGGWWLARRLRNPGD